MSNVKDTVVYDTSFRNKHNDVEKLVIDMSSKLSKDTNYKYMCT